MSKRIDLTGRVFGRLTVIECVGKNKQGCAVWHCRCECGNEKDISGSNLRRGSTLSCGCYMRECESERVLKRNTAHGQTNTRLYRVWKGMIARCENEANIGFKFYGECGVKVCERWHSYEAFFEDMGSGYAPGLTLDRVDTRGDYCKENCRWATWEEQGQNKRNTILINGVSLKKYCRDNDISYAMALARVEKGWPVEKAVSIPCTDRKDRRRGVLHG